MHDREQIYRSLWERTNRNGILLKTQTEVAKEIGIPYQKLSQIITEFIQDGRVRKYKHKFQFMDPDLFEWTDRHRKPNR